MTYNDAVLYAWLSQSEIADFFGVTIQTVQNWTNSNNAPTGVIQALKLMAGDCPVLSAKDGWQGWRFKGGFLWSPNGESFTPGDIRASKMDYDIIRGYERETARLYKEIKALKASTANQSAAPTKTAIIIPFPARGKASRDLLA